MMSITLKTVKDCSMIYSNGESVLLFGKNLWVFRADGSFVAKHKTIRNPSKCAFLPGNKALIDGGGDGSYHYISLDSGEIIWSTLKKGRRYLESTRFAVSPDGSTVYDICYIGFQELKVDRLCPEMQLHDSYLSNDTLRVSNDIFCQADGSLCILQSHLIVDPQDPYAKINPPTRQNGILKVDFSSGVPQQCWYKRWESDGRCYNPMLGCDGSHILHADFTVKDMNTAETIDLLENENDFVPPRETFTWHFDEQRKILIATYVGENSNVLIDCKARKRIAQYTKTEIGTGYKGCLIGNEYWVGTPTGVIRKEFPIIESV